MSGKNEIEKGVARCANCGSISPIEITPAEEVRPLGMQGRSCCTESSYQLLTLEGPDDAYDDD